MRTNEEIAQQSHLQALRNQLDAVKGEITAEATRMGDELNTLKEMGCQTVEQAKRQYALVTQEIPTLETKLTNLLSKAEDILNATEGTNPTNPTPLGGGGRNRTSPRRLNT